MLLRCRAPKSMLRSITAAAVPAMASCFILSGCPSALTSAVGSRFQLGCPNAYAPSCISKQVCSNVENMCALSHIPTAAHVLNIYAQYPEFDLLFAMAKPALRHLCPMYQLVASSPSSLVIRTAHEMFCGCGLSNMT